MSKIVQISPQNASQKLYFILSVYIHFIVQCASFSSLITSRNMHCYDISQNFTIIDCLIANY